LTRGLWLWAADLRREFDALEPEIRDSVWKKLWARAKADPRMGFASILYGGCGVLLARYIVEFYGARFASLQGTLFALAVYGVNLVVVVALTGWLVRRRFHRMFREEVRLIGIRVCLGCGYDLRGTSGRTTCPECGMLDYPSW